MKLENLEIPQSIIESIKQAEKASLKFQENIGKVISQIPNIDIPDISIPDHHDFHEVVHTDLAKEDNVWKRHAEMIDIQNTLLVVLQKILEEQKSTSKMTKSIIWLTIVSIICAISALIISSIQIVPFY